jgi:hypothetical protein
MHAFETSKRKMIQLHAWGIIYLKRKKRKKKNSIAMNASITPLKGNDAGEIVGPGIAVHHLDARQERARRERVHLEQAHQEQKGPKTYRPKRPLPSTGLPDVHNEAPLGLTHGLYFQWVRNWRL